MNVVKKDQVCDIFRDISIKSKGIKEDKCYYQRYFHYKYTRMSVQMTIDRITAILSLKMA